MFKKIISLLLVFTVSTVIFCGCNEKKTESSPDANSSQEMSSESVNSDSDSENENSEDTNSDTSSENTESVDTEFDGVEDNDGTSSENTDTTTSENTVSENTENKDDVVSDIIDSVVSDTQSDSDQNIGSENVENLGNGENSTEDFEDVTDGWEVEEEEKVETEEEDIYADSKKINFYVDGLFQFNIVRPDDMDDDSTDIVKSTIFKTARAINKKRPNYLTDADNLDTGLKNIFIGDTKNALSAETAEKLKGRPNNHYDYVIMVKNGDIAINAVTNEGLQNALDYFCTEILYDLDSVIPEDYMIHYQPGANSESPLKIAGKDISEFAIMCSKYPTGMEMKGAEELQEAIKTFTGVEIPILKGEKGDYVRFIQLKEAGTDRKAYSLSVSEGNLILSGGMDYSLNAATHVLAMNIKSVPSDKVINIPEGYSYSGIYTDKTKGTGTYQLVWADDFDGDSINTEYWKLTDYMRYNTHRSPEAISVKDGCMTITSWPTTFEDGTEGFISGEVEGKNVNFAYGYFEIRAKLPRGSGNWASFWACGKNTAEHPYRLEIDVFETFGVDGILTSNIHSWWNSGRPVRGLAYTEAEKNAGHIGHLGKDALCIINSVDGANSYKLPDVKSFADDWHTYGCEWTPSRMKFYCDGVCYTEVNLESMLYDPNAGYKTSPFLMATNGRPLNIIIGNLLDAPDGSKPIDETTELPSKYSVDYVHLYQIDGVGGIFINE